MAKDETRLKENNILFKAKGRKFMTREQFIIKAKELAIDFWTMNLHDGTYESHLIDLLTEFENSTQENNRSIISQLDNKILDLEFKILDLEFQNGVLQRRVDFIISLTSPK